MKTEVEGAMESIQSQLEVDKYALDEEWEKQPNKSYEYNQLLAETILERDRARSRMDKQRALLDKDIREFPDSYGIKVSGDKKPTEVAIASAIEVNEDYQAAVEDLNQKQYEMNVMKAVCSAWEMKRAALEWLTKLFLNQYYAEPKISDTDKEQFTQRVGFEAHQEALNQSGRRQRAKL